ncbi:heavy-metal-associated domain-containing protein [Polluticaenibacter yanchengensis]|uniref:Heavy-metal-associated domain-containing protein n=1 Tax=Polluticaenibacter yanchengensis TaxID=3014562 RepID=A0ABT4UP30_9BACT|nr:heavy-metal-associated domain-containing protein [Chitinophagaceae bacterium LY-5]
MKNKILQFKTNINCASCVASVTPFLDNAEGIENWDIDTQKRDKILTVMTEGITEREVIKAVENAGFKIEPIK